MVCSRRLYKGNSYEICLPMKESGVTSVFFYTDGELKIEKTPVISGDTMCFDIDSSDIDPIADGVLRYEAFTEDGSYDTNTPFVIITPEGYDAKTLDEIKEESYQSGYTDGLEECEESGCTEAYEEGYESGSTDGYNSGYTEGLEDGYDSGYTSGSTDGYESGYTSGSTDGFQSGYTSGSTDGYASGYTSGYTDGIATCEECEQAYESGYTDGYASGSTDGYNSGYTSGTSVGYDSGYTEGYASGYTSGETAGYQSGYTSGVTDGFQSGYTSGSTDGYASGYTSGRTDGITYQKSLLIGVSFDRNGIFTREDGYNQVTVNVPQTGYTQDDLDNAYDSGYTSGYTSGSTDGYNSGYTEGEAYQKSKLVSTAITVNGTYSREDGFSSVVVNIPQTGYTQQDLDNAYASGCTDGFQSGYTSGTSVGYDSGYTDGYQSGYTSGLTAGYQSGYTQGYEDGQEHCGHDYSQDYLTIEALSAGTLYVRSEGVGYSINDGTWETTTTSSPLNLNNGDKVRFKATPSTAMEGLFSGNTMSFNVYGNIESLEYGDNFSSQTTVKNEKAFSYVFYNCSGLVNAENLIIPATTLKNLCCQSMFKNCSALATVPELPATTLAMSCYNEMFFGCISITTAPELPATSLTFICYQGMFNGCTSLTTAPELPATTLAMNCYNAMFRGCTVLNYIKCLATDDSGTTNWVVGVAPSGTFVKNPNMQSWTTGDNGIPSGWTVVDSQ